MTFSKGSGPRLLNTDAFHMAARANMTDEAPVAFLNSSTSAFVFTRSREPPLQERPLQRRLGFSPPDKSLCTRSIHKFLNLQFYAS